MAELRLRALKEKVMLHGDAGNHEQTDSWSNRDLIPLPPSRRTWGWFHYFGYWTLSSLNVSNWQTPNTFLCELQQSLVNDRSSDDSTLTAFGLFVGQSMMVIVVGRFLISFFSILIAWCGLRWHIGFTVQNRYTWGLRGSYIPLLQRILLNFIWCAIQWGLVVTVNGDSNPPRGLEKLYFMAFLVGFFVSGTIFVVLNKTFPHPGMGKVDDVDVYETFTPQEAAELGMAQLGDTTIAKGQEDEREGKRGGTETIIEKTQ